MWVCELPTKGNGLAGKAAVDTASRLHCPLLICEVRPPRQALMNTKSDMELNLVYPGNGYDIPLQGAGPDLLHQAQYCETDWDACV